VHFQNDIHLLIFTFNNLFPIPIGNIRDEIFAVLSGRQSVGWFNCLKNIGPFKKKAVSTAGY
jgi:hypothetical protein